MSPEVGIARWEAVVRGVVFLAPICIIVSMERVFRRPHFQGIRHNLESFLEGRKR